MKNTIVNTNKIALTNLGLYNEGILKYEWLELPFSEEELENTLNKIGINEEYEEYEEYFISDYEFLFEYKISEYENIQELNELFELLENLYYENDDLYDFIDAYMTKYGSDIKNAIECYTNDDYMVYHDCLNMADVAYNIIEESGVLNSKDDLLSRYFDYTAYGRDLQIEGNFIEFKDGYIQIF